MKKINVDICIANTEWKIQMLKDKITELEYYLEKLYKLKARGENTDEVHN